MIHFMFKVTEKFHNIRFDSRSFVQANLIPPSGRKDDGDVLRFYLDCLDFHNNMYKCSDTGRKVVVLFRKIVNNWPASYGHIIWTYHMVFSSF